jgi:small subunit ribosomal protein S17
VKKLQGIVFSAKLEQTAIVVVENSWKHPLYQKMIKRSKKYLVQNDVKAKVGDNVELAETRPLSARKRFTITQILKKN